MLSPHLKFPLLLFYFFYKKKKRRRGHAEGGGGKQEEGGKKGDEEMECNIIVLALLSFSTAKPKGSFFFFKKHLPYTKGPITFLISRVRGTQPHYIGVYIMRGGVAPCYRRL